MPALTCDFDEILSSFSPGVESEKGETLPPPPPPPPRSFGDDILVSSTTLESLLGLAEDGATHAHCGRAERGIVARHLRRAFSSKSRLGNGGGAAANSTTNRSATSVVLSSLLPPALILPLIALLAQLVSYW